MPPNRGSSNRDIKYVCTECGRDVGSKHNLIAKIVSFRGIGMKAGTVRSRTVAWLCIIPNGPEPSCRDKDAAWNMPERSGAPGLADTRLARPE